MIEVDHQMEVAEEVHSPQTCATIVASKDTGNNFIFLYKSLNIIY